MVSNGFHKLMAVALAMVVVSSVKLTASDSDRLTFSDVRLRATTAGMPSSAAYLKITNNGISNDQLIAARAAIAKRIEIHSMEMDNGVMRMRAINSGLSIAAGDSLTLTPGGYHIMLMGLYTDLAPGTKHEIILVFEKAGEIKITATANRPEDIMMKMPGQETSPDQSRLKKSQ